MPGYVYYSHKESTDQISSLETFAVVGIVVAVIAVVIGIAAFAGVAAFTSVASVVIPSVVKITTWSMAASELINCIFLSVESLLIGAAFGFIKKLIQRKQNNYTSSSLKNNKNLVSSTICNASIGMAIGFFSGISGVNGIIQSTIFNVSLNPQSLIGMVIVSGGAGGIAGNGGILLFLLLLLIFIIQGAIIGIIVGAILGSFSGLLTSAVRHGIIETNIILLNDSYDKTDKVFLKYIFEGIVLGCLLGFLHGVITGKEAVANHESIKNPNIKIEKHIYEPRYDVDIEQKLILADDPDVMEEPKIPPSQFYKELSKDNSELTGNREGFAKIKPLRMTLGNSIDPILYLEPVQRKAVYLTLNMNEISENTLSAQPAEKIFLGVDSLKKSNVIITDFDAIIKLEYTSDVIKPVTKHKINTKALPDQLYNTTLFGTKGLKDIDKWYFDKYLKHGKKLPQKLTKYPNLSSSIVEIPNVEISADIIEYDGSTSDTEYNMEQEIQKSIEIVEMETSSISQSREENIDIDYFNTVYNKNIDTEALPMEKIEIFGD